VSLSSDFLSPVQLRRGSDKVSLVGTWHPARVNVPQGGETLEEVPQRSCGCLIPGSVQA